MTDHPMIFSAEMVRALLDRRKTQTRRLLKPQPQSVADKIDAAMKWRIGDRIWVKEAWRASPDYNAYPPREMSHWPVHYEADGPPPPEPELHMNGRLRASIFMPKWASRLTLTVTNVRVQRVQDITEADARAEGAKAGDWPDRPKCSCDDEDCVACSHYPALYKPAFRHIWNSIHGPDAWDRNDWIVALTFDVHKRNIMEMDG